MAGKRQETIKVNEERGQPEPQGSTVISLENLAGEFHCLIGEFSDLFVCHRKDNTDTAHKYMCGLIQSERSNMERMEEAVPGTDYESLQQFISNSPWSYRDVICRVAVKADELLGGTGGTALIIDESGFAKKGKTSVGVARQWNGRLGKTDNCQVAVYGALSSGDRVILIDVELFLPKGWTEDAARCLRSGVPETRIENKTKPELALEIVRRQRELGIRFDYVLADGLYGHSAKFCQMLDDEEELFLMHVHSDQHVYVEDPRPCVPLRKSAKGRPPTKLKAQTAPIRVAWLMKTVPEDKWERVTVRESTEGDLIVDAYQQKVRLWDGEENKAREWVLYIRRDVGTEDVKYCVANVPEGTPLKTLARMEAQRFRIERGFEDAKGQAGMAEYQIRGWLAWHHHMASVMMVMLFMTRHRMLRCDEYPLLSCYDIKVLLTYFLPRRDTAFNEVLRQMEVRHAKRRAASESKAKRQLALEPGG